ncbi:MAG: GNAT family N-acetyltransferase [Actinobacteria bacterium]|nr:GNAT family N-acetyltransferase [Actinomycetota bacterium]
MTALRAISAGATYSLRRLVLRSGDMTADVAFPQDENLDAFHLGAFDHELVGIASFSPTPTRYREGSVAWQLRGMAIAHAQQGKGIGAQIVAAAVERLRNEGASVLWCNARDSAAAFYEKLGFVTEGDGFTTEATGLPHHVMVLDL